MRGNNRKRIKDNKNGQDEIVFRSSKYLMTFVLYEYTRERERSERLDGKGIALMTVLVGFLTLSFPAMNFGFVINSFYIRNSTVIRLGAICVVFLIFAFVFAFYTLITILKIFKIREYKRFNTENAKEIDIECHPENIVADSLINVYVDNIKYNQEINNEKADLIERSYKFVIISVIMLLLITILTIIGGTIMENELRIDQERIDKAVEITANIDGQNACKPIEMKKSVKLKHSLFVKDLKPIKESID